MKIVIDIEENIYRRFINGFANEDDSCLIEHLFKNGTVIAPTGEPEKAKVGELINAYTKGFDAGVEITRTEGEWIMVTEPDGFTHSKCSNCNQFNDWGDVPFCPWCGSKNKGGGNKKETTFDDYLKKQLENPEFRKEWEKLCDEERQKGG